MMPRMIPPRMVVRLRTVGRGHEGPAQQPDEGGDREGDRGEGQAVRVAGHVRLGGEPAKSEVDEAGTEEHDGGQDPRYIEPVIRGIDDRVVRAPSRTAGEPDGRKGQHYGGGFLPGERVGRVEQHEHAHRQHHRHLGRDGHHPEPQLLRALPDLVEHVEKRHSHDHPRE